jgi:hypothetical protein
MDGSQVGDLCGDYTGAVRQLLLVGEASGCDPAGWPDYAAAFGIGHEHVAELLRMAGDPALHRGDPDSSAVWAPVHAWRALGRLRAEAAAEPLLALLKTLEDDDAANEDIPVVLGMIGPAAIPHLAAFIADRSNPPQPVYAALTGLGEVAARHPECRDECVGLLARTLEPHPDEDATVNGFAVWALMDLHAVEAVEAIREAFGRNSVDLSVVGDLEDVEIDLGLRSHRATPARRYLTLPTDWLPRPAADRPRPVAAAPVRHEKVGRNAPCPCGSGKKYKKCCLP